MEIVISDTNIFIDLWNIGLLVYHQYSVPTILQVVTPISFLKKLYLLPTAVSLCACRHSNEEKCIN